MLPELCGCAHSTDGEIDLGKLIAIGGLHLVFLIAEVKREIRLMGRIIHEARRIRSREGQKK